MKFRNFPTVKCPHCNTWICNTTDRNIQTTIIEEKEVITPNNLDADIVIRCPKCKEYIALKQKKTEQPIRKSTA